MRRNSLLSVLGALVLSGSIALLLPGCGGGSWGFNVVGTPRDPGAEGHFQVERIEGGNRMVTATLNHMTPPDRLGESNTVYIMWFRDPRGASTKASVLQYDPGSRTGRATATTPLTTFLIQVTAERNASVVEPSENVVFTQRVNTE